MVEAAAQLTFDGETLRYTPPDRLGWEVHVSQVLIAGESTYGGAERGVEPTYCFMDKNGAVYQVPYSATGCQFAMAAMSRAMKTNLGFTFHRARPFESRVIWPRSIRGKAMFIYTRQPAKGLLGRIFRAPEVEQTPSPEVLQMLEEQTARTKKMQPVGRK